MGKDSVEQKVCFLESLSGLCGQAVNEGSFDEMIWIEINNNSYHKILKSSQESLNITKVIRMDIWDLLEHLVKKKKDYKRVCTL